MGRRDSQLEIAGMGASPPLHLHTSFAFHFHPVRHPRGDIIA